MGLVLLGVSVLTFFIAHVVPADPVLAALGEHAREDQIRSYRHAYGLDRPVGVQYLIYVHRLLAGDFGISIRTRRPVAEDLGEFLPATVELGGTAWLVALLLGIPAGILSAIYKDRIFDHLARIGSLIGASMPVFWLGLLLLGSFYYRLRWLPGPGRLDISAIPPPPRTGLLLIDSALAGDGVVFWSALRHLVLPALTLGLFSTAVIARMTRSAMLEVLYQDYIRTARAKGLARARIVLRHALRNAMIPTLTIVGISFGNLLSGAVLTETVFAWPGLGRYATTSAISLDFPAVMGVTIVAAVIYTTINLVIDLLYARLDPRVRYEYAGSPAAPPVALPSRPAPPQPAGHARCGDRAALLARCTRCSAAGPASAADPVPGGAVGTTERAVSAWPGSAGTGYLQPLTLRGASLAHDRSGGGRHRRCVGDGRGHGRRVRRRPRCSRADACDGYLFCL